MEAVNNGFGNGYVTAKSSADALNSAFDVNMQYQVLEGSTALHRRTVEDITSAVNDSFESRKRMFDSVSSLFAKFMAFMFLRVLYSAYKYHKGYVTDFNHDNIYISNYFRWIDARRRYVGKKTLMPFKKLEEHSIMKSGKASLTKDEKKKVVMFTAILSAQAVACGLMLFIDKVIFEIMDLIRRHSQIEYKQKGTHHITLMVEGRGAMGRLVKSLLNGFNKKHSINSNTSNAECLPRPTVTSEIEIYTIFGLIFLAWIFTVFEAYSLRLRHVFAGFFYPRREKRRTLYLYNDLMRKRKGYLKLCRQKAREEAKERKLQYKMDLLTTLRYKFPRLCGCLKSFGAKKKCLICDETEKSTFVKCDCKVVYCPECWQDVDEICYFCKDKDYLDTESDEDLAAQLALAGKEPPPFMELPPAVMKDMPLYGGLKPISDSDSDSDSSKDFNNSANKRTRNQRRRNMSWNNRFRAILPSYDAETAGENVYNTQFSERRVLLPMNDNHSVDVEVSETSALITTETDYSTITLDEGSPGFLLYSSLEPGSSQVLNPATTMQSACSPYQRYNH